MPSQESDGNFIYYFYEVDAINEPTTVPFDRFVTYVNKHPGTQFFLFADRCTKDKIDGWLNNDHVTVHWCEVSQVLFRLSRWENLEHAEKI